MAFTRRVHYKMPLFPHSRYQPSVSQSVPDVLSNRVASERTSASRKRHVTLAAHVRGTGSFVNVFFRNGSGCASGSRRRKGSQLFHHSMARVTACRSWNPFKRRAVSSWYRYSPSSSKSYSLIAVLKSKMEARSHPKGPPTGSILVHNCFN